MLFVNLSVLTGNSSEHQRISDLTDSWKIHLPVYVFNILSIRTRPDIVIDGRLSEETRGYLPNTLLDIPSDQSRRQHTLLVSVYAYWSMRQVRKHWAYKNTHRWKQNVALYPRTRNHIFVQISPRIKLLFFAFCRGTPLAWNISFRGEK